MSKDQQQTTNDIAPDSDDINSTDNEHTNNLWKEDLNNLLTPQTVSEQAQIQRRKRNREAARRSRQKQKEREQELVERQAQLSERLKSLEDELKEWRIINASTGVDERLIEIEEVEDGDGELADNINNVYRLTMDTLRIISELQLQLDEITKELNSMLQSSSQ